MIETVCQYFPNISELQKSRLSRLYKIYEDWNQKINVLSRKDFDNFYMHHVLHSLAIYKFIQFKNGTKILDLGTGGGFPSVPLAIIMPDIDILAVDSIRKKLTVVDAVREEIGLRNLKTQWSRIEEIDGQYDFIVSRAVAPLSDLIRWSRGKIHPISFNRVNNGLITLKGGDLQDEIQDAKLKTTLTPISEYFHEDFFDTKWVTYTKLSKK